MSALSTAGPLAGFSIGVTADRRAEEQIELLRRRGADVIHGPSIRTLPLDAEDELRVVTNDLIARPPDYVVANTGLGMRVWFAAAESWDLDDALFGALGQSRIVARGHKAASVVTGEELALWERAPDERLDSVGRILIGEDLHGARVAVQLHGADAPDFVASLREAGAEVVVVPVYQWKLPDDHEPARRLIEATCARRLAAITFTAAPAITNLFAIAEEQGLASDLRDACNETVIAACVGPVCAEAATAAGIVAPLIPHRSRLGTMVLALTERLASRPPRPLGGEAP